MSQTDDESGFDAEEFDKAMQEVEGDVEDGDVPDLTADEVQYDRDEDGNLKPRREIIDTANGPRAVYIKPITPTALMAMQDRYGSKDDLEPSAVFELMNRYVIEPDVEWGSTTKLQATMSLIEVLFGQFSDDTDGLKADIADEIQKRDDGDSGN